MSLVSGIIKQFKSFKDKFVSDKIPKRCSVKDCASKSLDSSLFQVKEKWLNLNPVGWKNHQQKYICSEHFCEEDICKTGRVPLVKRTASPRVFLSNFDLTR